MLFVLCIISGINLNELKESFGSSNELIKSLNNKWNPNVECGKALSDELLQEAKLLASCEYENDTTWGKEASLNLIQKISNKCKYCFDFNYKHFRIS